MVALDRVGVGAVVPVGSGGPPTPCAPSCVRAAARAGVPTVAETGQRSSDHWSFVREGLPGARLGSTPYAAYHSPDDVPAVVEPRPAASGTARLVVAWLRSLTPQPAKGRRCSVRHSRSRIAAARARTPRREVAGPIP